METENYIQYNFESIVGASIRGVNLFESAKKGDIYGLQRIAHIINLDVQEEATGNTALHYAVRNGDALMADYLLNQNIKYEIRNKMGETPISLAEKYKIAQILIVFGRHGLLKHSVQ